MKNYHSDIECILSGVKINVITRPSGDYAKKDSDAVSSVLGYFSNKGIAVIEKSRIHQKFAVVDERVVWYGSINLLSYGGSEESIMRLESATIASELLRVMRD